MTNFYELDKQATQGPFVAEDWWILAPSGWKADRDAWVLGASETVHIASTNENRRPHEEQAANARLLAHCRSHFKEALGFLEALLGCQNEDEAHDLIVNHLPELVDKLETVL